MRHISLVSQEVRQIVNQISELDLSASAKTVGGAFAVAAVWAVVSLIAVYSVFKRRDI